MHIGTIEESSVARIRKQYCCRQHLRLPIYNAEGGEKDEGVDVTLGKWEDFNNDILIYFIEMDFVNELLGSTSCNVDGSMDMNPLMSFADQMLTADTYQCSASTAPERLDLKN